MAKPWVRLREGIGERLEIGRECAKDFGGEILMILRLDGSEFGNKGLHL